MFFDLIKCSILQFVNINSLKTCFHMVSLQSIKMLCFLDKPTNSSPCVHYPTLTQRAPLRHNGNAFFALSQRQLVYFGGFPYPRVSVANNIVTRMRIKL